MQQEEEKAFSREGLCLAIVGAVERIAGGRAVREGDRLTMLLARPETRDTTTWLGTLAESSSFKVIRHGMPFRTLSYGL